jgi:hypothetical protein
MKQILITLVAVAVMFSGVANACIGDFCEPIDTPDVTVQLDQSVAIDGMTFEVDTVEVGCNADGMYEVTHLNAVGSAAGVSASIGAEVTDKGNYDYYCYGCDYTTVSGKSVIDFDGAVNIGGDRIEVDCDGAAWAGYSGELNFEGTSSIDFQVSSY